MKIGRRNSSVLSCSSAGASSGLYCATDHAQEMHQLRARQLLMATPGLRAAPARRRPDARGAARRHRAVRQPPRRAPAPAIRRTRIAQVRVGWGGDRRIASLLGIDPSTVATGRPQIVDRDVEVDRRAGGPSPPAAIHGTKIALIERAGQRGEPRAPSRYGPASGRGAMRGGGAVSCLRIGRRSRPGNPLRIWRSSWLRRPASRFDSPSRRRSRVTTLRVPNVGRRCNRGVAPSMRSSA